MRKSRVSELLAHLIRCIAMVAPSSFVLCGALWGQSAPAPQATTAPSPARAPAATATGPRLQAELLKPIDANQAKVGDEVMLKTVQPLESSTARNIRPGLWCWAT